MNLYFHFFWALHSHCTFYWTFCKERSQKFLKAQRLEYQTFQIFTIQILWKWPNHQTWRYITSAVSIYYKVRSSKCFSTLSSVTQSNIYDGMFCESRSLQGNVGCAYLFSKKLLKIGHMLKIENVFKGYFQVSELFFLNAFVPNAPFLYPLKTSENRPVFWYFQGVEKGCIGDEWVKLVVNKIFKIV